MDRPLEVSIIGDSDELVNAIVSGIDRSVFSINKDSFITYSDFLKKQIGYQPDVIIYLISSISDDWKNILIKSDKTYIHPLVVYILPCTMNIDLVVQMINAGACYVLEMKNLSNLPVLLYRITKDIDQRAISDSLSIDKNISDNILRHSRSMLTVINRDYIYERANSKFCTAHHISEDQIEGRTLAEIWGHDNFENNIKKNIDNCFLGKTVHYEASFQTPAQGKRYFDVSFRPLKTRSNKITHLLAETFDITDIKLSRQAYDDIEKEFKEMETNIPIGYLRCDIEGNILHVNSAFLRIMEYEDENRLLKVNLKNLYVEESLFRIHLEQILFYNSKTFSRVTLKTGMGKEIPCRLTAILVTHDNKKTPYIDFSFEDSTRELVLENRLHQAQKLETIGSLAGGLAHDFNNILATIYGYSELIQSEISENSPVSVKVGKIITAVARARSLTNQILTFSRQVEQEKIYVSIWKVLRETIDFVRAGIPANIIITDNVKKTNATVFADPTQLFRVFLNLMTNSVQAMEGMDGRLKIDLSIVKGELIINELNKDIVADDYALISFKDTGIGMDSSLVNRIFEPFFTTRDVGKGTGLGLSVVHGIISEIEGEIFVSSKKHSGTTFDVYIPVSKHNTKENKTTKNAKQILFVSGNDHESRILSMALQNSGFKLVFVSDYELLSKILDYEKHQHDLILFMDDSTDFNKESLINILLQKKLEIPVLLITDYEHCFLDEKIVNSGIIKQELIKPVSLKEVRTAIQFSLNY